MPRDRVAEFGAFVDRGMKLYEQLQNVNFVEGPLSQSVEGLLPALYDVPQTPMPPREHPPIPWDAITQLPLWKTASPEARRYIRDRHFQDVVLPTLATRYPDITPDQIQAVAWKHLEATNASLRPSQNGELREQTSGNANANANGTGAEPRPPAIWGSGATAGAETTAVDLSDSAFAAGFAKQGEGTLGDVWRRGANAFMSDLVANQFRAMEQMPPGTTVHEFGRLFGKGVEFIGNYHPTGNPWEDAARAVELASEAVFGKPAPATGKYAGPISSPKELLDPKRLYQMIGEGGPVMAGLIGAQMANPAAAAMLIMGMETGRTAKAITDYETTNKVQLSPMKKAAISLTAGGIKTILFQLPLGRLIEAGNPAVRTFTKMADGSLVKAAIGTAMQIGTMGAIGGVDKTAQAVYDQFNHVGLPEVGQAVWQSMLAAVPVSVGLGGAMLAKGALGKGALGKGSGRSGQKPETPPPTSPASGGEGVDAQFSEKPKLLNPAPQPSGEPTIGDYRETMANRAGKEAILEETSTAFATREQLTKMVVLAKSVWKKTPEKALRGLMVTKFDKFNANSLTGPEADEILQHLWRQKALSPEAIKGFSQLKFLDDIERSWMDEEASPEREQQFKQVAMLREKILSGETPSNADLVVLKDRNGATPTPETPPPTPPASGGETTPIKTTFTPEQLIAVLGLHNVKVKAQSFKSSGKPRIGYLVWGLPEGFDVEAAVGQKGTKTNSGAWSFGSDPSEKLAGALTKLHVKEARKEELSQIPASEMKKAAEADVANQTVKPPSLSERVRAFDELTPTEKRLAYEEWWQKGEGNGLSGLSGLSGQSGQETKTPPPAPLASGEGKNVLASDEGEKDVVNKFRKAEQKAKIKPVKSAAAVSSPPPPAVVAAEPGDSQQIEQIKQISETPPPATPGSGGEGANVTGGDAHPTNVETAVETKAKGEAERIDEIEALATYRLQPMLSSGQKIDSRVLFDHARQVFGGMMVEGTFESKEAYDALELAANQVLKNHPKLFSVTSDDPIHVLKRIKDIITDLMPSMTKRTAETDAYQQFSTPPEYAFMVNWIAGVNEKDVVLEPSAGVGGLAVFAKSAGAKVIVNELAPRRRALLERLGFDRVFGEDAEQINNILPADVRPSVVVMNPPFSAAGSRGVKGPDIVKRHIEQALALLKPGGRLVAIVGAGRDGEGGVVESSKAFGKWFEKLKETATVRANISVAGEVYAKMGTSFPTRILVIDKTPGLPGEIVRGKAGSLEELAKLTEAVRDERQPIEGATAGKRTADQPSSEGEAVSGGSEAGSGIPVLPAAHVMGGADKQGNIPEKLPAQSDQGQHPSSDATRAIAQGGNGVPVDQQRGAGLSGSGKREGSAKSSVGDSGGDAAGRLGIRAERTGAVRVLEKRSEDAKLGLYRNYVPEIQITGAHPHPTLLVESAAMAAIAAPPISYNIHLPPSVIKDGLISEAQIEPVARAGAAHGVIFDNGERQGYFIGDGPGGGKGREIAGILWDNFNQGRDKAIWISERVDLMNDAQRDLEGIGWEDAPIWALNRYKGSSELPVDRHGIMFTTYSTLRATGKEAEGVAGVKRIDQISNWLGEGFDGVIIFDEAHNMANSGRGGGMQKPAQQALAGIELQRRFPKARVVYSSATGATNVENLAYATRLGLWGPTQPFTSVDKFISAISNGGVAAMEKVAGDLKAMGLYTARSLSFDGVEHATLEHKLTPEQTKNYNELAKGWQIVLTNLRDFFDKRYANPASRAMGEAAFWSAEQRFFNQLLTSMSMETVIKDAEAELKAGNCVVFSLVNTMEAQAKRKMAEIETAQDVEEFNVSPLQILMDYLKHTFPTAQYEKVVENGEVIMRPVKDKDGNQVQNKEAEKARDDLLTRFGALKVPDGPLESLLFHFGPERIAEVTGRSTQIQKGKDGKIKFVKRGAHANEAELKAFNDGQKLALILSQAGGTGSSAHSDRTFINQRRRIHYGLQMGWSSSRAIQVLGRTHRSNEVVPPYYKLVTTDVAGHKRFISTIARRLDQLGALVKGQRETGGQGIFDAMDNLENDYAQRALTQTLFDISRGGLETLGVSGKVFAEETGVDLRNMDLSEKQTEISVPRFLNRLLAMTLKNQEVVFNSFFDKLANKIAIARETGEYDNGIENLRAEHLVVEEEKPVRTDPNSGTQTDYVRLKLQHKRHVRSFDDLKNGKADGTFGNPLLSVIKNVNTGAVYALVEPSHGRWNEKEYRGKVRLLSPDGAGRIEDSYKFGQSSYWDKFAPDDKLAKTTWNAAVKALPEYREETRHLITGLIVPVWDTVVQPGTKIQVHRAVTDDGRSFLGLDVHEKDIGKVLNGLGALSKETSATDSRTAFKGIATGTPVTLSNGWRVKRSMVAGEPVNEIIGPTADDIEGLREMGVHVERDNYTTRFTLPQNELGEQIFSKITKYRPVVEETPPPAPPASGGGDSQQIEPRDSQQIEQLKRISEEEGVTPESKAEEEKYTLMNCGPTLDDFFKSAEWLRDLIRSWGGKTGRWDLMESKLGVGTRPIFDRYEIGKTRINPVISALIQEKISLISRPIAWMDDAGDQLNALERKYVAEQFFVDYQKFGVNLRPEVTPAIRNYAKMWDQVSRYALNIMDKAGVQVNMTYRVSEWIPIQMKNLADLEERARKGEEGLSHDIAGKKGSITHWKKQVMAGVEWTNEGYTDPISKHVRKNYIPHMPTDEVREAITEEEGPLYNAIVIALTELGIDMDLAKSWADNKNKAPVDRKFSAIEESRLANLPLTITMPDGKVKKFLETNMFKITDWYMSGVGRRVATIDCIRQVPGYDEATYPDYHDAIRHWYEDVSKKLKEQGGGKRMVGLFDAVWNEVTGKVQGIDLLTASEPYVKVGLGLESFARSCKLSMASISQIAGLTPLFAKVGVKNGLAGILMDLKAGMGNIEAQDFLQFTREMGGWAMDETDYLEDTFGFNKSWVENKGNISTKFLNTSMKISREILKWTLFNFSNRHLDKICSVGGVYLSRDIERDLKFGGKPGERAAKTLKREHSFTTFDIERMREHGMAPKDVERIVQDIGGQVNLHNMNILDAPNPGVYKNQWMRRILVFKAFQFAAGTVMSDCLFEARQNNFRPLATFLVGQAAGNLLTDILKNWIADKIDKDSLLLRLGLSMLCGATLGYWGGLADDIVWQYRISHGKVSDMIRNVGFKVPMAGFYFDVGYRTYLYGTDKDRYNWHKLCKTVPAIAAANVQVWRVVEGRWHTDLNDPQRAQKAVLQSNYEGLKDLKDESSGSGLIVGGH